MMNIVVKDTFLKQILIYPKQWKLINAINMYSIVMIKKTVIHIRALRASIK